MIAKQGNNAVVLTSATDYYSGGMAVSNRNIVGDYRYSFQGQEKDAETGKVAFQLRLYDPRINRWLPQTLKESSIVHTLLWVIFINLIDLDGGSTAEPLDDYKLNKDGSIELVKLTDDNFDRLLDSDGVEIGQVNKGFLSDGINIQNNGLFLDVLNKKDFHSYIAFIDNLSVSVNKEFGGLFLEDKNNFDNIYITPYKNSLPKSTVSTVNWLNNDSHKISQQIYKVGTKFHKAVAWFHTHPDIMNGGGYTKHLQQIFKLQKP